ncbi:nuclear transport factor 2 family protein [Flavobacterium sp.]|uniref:nuclear transport factor 2 family protein n=1 Tax=Flavobacterium sp. TaxID=239 RepID=UPI00120F0274|nr:nuclear transport factor 2 family protein [Flavobacterium sp.]RZJ69100.1 MAG: nuclear transport factor 2 family protein [Flavobacterium sp.]
MKNLKFFALAIALASCNQEVRYTQTSPEIDAYKKANAAYENRDWESLKSFYSDTAKIQNNVLKKDAQTIDQLIATNKDDEKMFSTWELDKKEAEYEMVRTDKGETWVNYWGIWRGTLKSTGKVYEMPMMLTARFFEGKIVREFGYWDTSKLALDLAEAGKTAIAEQVKTEVQKP